MDPAGVVVAVFFWQVLGEFVRDGVWMLVSEDLFRQDAPTTSVTDVPASLCSGTLSGSSFGRTFQSLTGWWTPDGKCALRLSAGCHRNAEDGLLQSLLGRRLVFRARLLARQSQTDVRFLLERWITYDANVIMPCWNDL